MSRSMPDDLLLDYATGAAPEALAVLAASHVALNPSSRRMLGQLEAVGGALMDELPPVRVDEGALERVMERLGVQESAVVDDNVDATLPAPLRPYAPAGIDALPWRHLAWGLSAADLPCQTPGGYNLRMLRIAAGRAIPRHAHDGEELVLVLRGGFTDQHGHYGRGDVCYADDATEHRPVADSDGECLCLEVSQGPVRFKGLLGLVLNPFLR